MAENRRVNPVRRATARGAQPHLRGIKFDDSDLFTPSPRNVFDDVQVTITGVPPQPIPPSPLGAEIREKPLNIRDQAFLKSTFELYRGRCECGEAYVNNCAHYLTDAMVRAGLPKPFPNAYEKCPKGRLKRAKETLEWFKTFKTGFKENHQGLALTGYWFVYQEDASGQGHVCVHLEASGSFTVRGTGDYSGWPVTWHYYY
jgi:hypothetical protein